MLSCTYLFLILNNPSLSLGCQTTASLDPPNMASANGRQATAPSGGDRDKGEESEAQDGRISVFIHKRDDQSSHEVIQPLLRYEKLWEHV